MTITFRLISIAQPTADGPIRLTLRSDDPEHANELAFNLADAPELKALRVGDEIKVVLQLPEADLLKP